jgi:hypothetical protein
MEKDKHLKQKKIILHEGKIKMGDGSFLPSGPKEMSIKDRVNILPSIIMALSFKRIGTILITDLSQMKN